MSWAMVAGAVISTVGSLVGGGMAKKREKEAAEKRKGYEDKLNYLEQTRQDIIDPSENITDLSHMISNPYANLQVATQAAEMQAEEADISLASSLDALRSSGASAGGATALAQAALRSKKGVSATIEKQEADNARLRAQGRAQADARRMSEATRVQGARAKGAEFMFGAREGREMQQLNRVAALMGQSQEAELAYGQQFASGIGSAIGAIGGMVATQDWGGGGTTTTPDVDTSGSLGSSAAIDPAVTGDDYVDILASGKSGD